MSRYRTVLKKCYITEEQNEIVNNLIEMTNHLSFSSYARKMLFKSSPIYLQFDFESYHDFIFQARRIINNLRQLERIAEQSEDLDNVRIFHYCVELMIEYEKKTSKQVKELVKRLNKKTR